MIPDLRAVLAAVVAGAGVSVLPSYLCTRELASGAIEKLWDPQDAPIKTPSWPAGWAVPSARTWTGCALACSRPRAWHDCPD